MPRQKQPPPGLPSEADVLEFIQSSPGIVGKREIARHFDIKGGDKVGLKALLKRMEQEGKLARRQRKLIDRSSLPPVTVLEIIGIDRDGEAFAEPVEWDERAAGKPPQVVITGGEGGPQGRPGAGQDRARERRALQVPRPGDQGAVRPLAAGARRLSHHQGPRRPHHPRGQEGPQRIAGPAGRRERRASTANWSKRRSSASAAADFPWRGCASGWATCPTSATSR